MATPAHLEAAPQSTLSATPTARRGMRFGALGPFLALTFGLFIVLLNRKAMLAHDGATTGVLMPGEEAALG